MPVRCVARERALTDGRDRWARFCFVFLRPNPFILSGDESSRRCSPPPAPPEPGAGSEQRRAQVKLLDLFPEASNKAAAEIAAKYDADVVGYGCNIGNEQQVRGLAGICACTLSHTTHHQLYSCMLREKCEYGSIDEGVISCGPLYFIHTESPSAVLYIYRESLRKEWCR